MAGKALNMNQKLKLYKLIILIILIIEISFSPCFAKSKEKLVDKSIYLTSLNNINITNDATKDLKTLKKLLNEKKPKAIYLEQWITMEPHNKNLLKNLKKIAAKNDIKFFLVIGKNVWFGDRGVKNTLAALNTYGEYIDGIVLRVEPNKSNIWKKEDDGLKVQILNLMLDAYAAIHKETRKRDKIFYAEFPFWLSDFKGPKNTFSQDACLYTDKLIFLIDDPDKLDKLNIRWNDTSCAYNIDLTKRATNQTEDSVREIFHKLKEKLVLYSNFNGYIVDSDSTLEDNLD